MKFSYIVPMVMMGLCAVVYAQVKPPPKRELTIPNMDSDSPSCLVKVPASAPCTPEGCTLPRPEESSRSHIKLEFTCGPISAPTGFENPAPEVKVQSFRVNNTWVHLSLVDGVFDPPEEPFRELNFCMYGPANHFCGFAKVRQLAHRPKVDEATTVKDFIREIEFQGTNAVMVK